MEKELFDGIMQGLNEAVEYSSGRLPARTIKDGVIRPASKKKAAAPLPEYTANEIKQIRSELEMTQSLFASFIGVSKKTVEAWERGTNKPSGAACRLLSVAQADVKFPEKYNLLVSL